LFLCYFEGKTRDEAARLTGCSLGTFKRRLEDAKERLGHRLARRGLTLSVALSMLGTVQGVSAGTMPALLAGVTVRTVLETVSGNTAAGVSESVCALAEGVLQSLVSVKVKIVGFLMLLAGTVALGLSAGPHAVSADPGSSSQTVALSQPTLIGKQF